MLGKEVQQDLVSSLVFTLYPCVIQIGSRSHPAMDLITEDLDVLMSLQIGLEFLDFIGVFVFGCE